MSLINLLKMILAYWEVVKAIIHGIYKDTAFRNSKRWENIMEKRNKITAQGITSSQDPTQTLLPVFQDSDFYYSAGYIGHRLIKILFPICYKYSSLQKYRK